MNTTLFRKRRLLVVSLSLAQAIFLGGAALAAAGEKTSPNWELEIQDGTIQHDKMRQEATLGRVINILRDKYPANVAMAPGLANVKIKDLKLSTFRWEQALEALRVASGGAFRWEKNQATQGEDSGEDLLTLTPDLSSALLSGRGVEVFNLASYMKDQDDASVSKVLTEIEFMMEETMEMLRTTGAEQPERPKVRFHPTAKLFVIVGEREALEAARKVLLALPGVTSSQAPYAYGGSGHVDPVTGLPLERYGIVRPSLPGTPMPAGGFGGGMGVYAPKPPLPATPGVAPSTQQRY